MQLSEQTKIEAQIGFTWGILIGATAAWIVVTFTTNWAWYFKLFSTLGSLGIIGSLILSLNEQIKARRNYLEVLKEMEKTNEEAQSQIELKGGQKNEKNRT